MIIYFVPAGPPAINLHSLLVRTFPNHYAHCYVSIAGCFASLTPIDSWAGILMYATLIYGDQFLRNRTEILEIKVPS